MNVLFCGKGLGNPPQEGIRNFTISLAKSLNEMGVKVDILTDGICFAEEGIKYIRLKEVNVKMLLKNYDIIHLHGTLLQMLRYKITYRNLKFVVNRYFPIRNVFEKMLIKIADKVIVASKYLLKMYLTTLDEDKISYITLACGEKFKDIRLERDIDILFNGGVAQSTGIYTLLSVAKCLKSVRFTLALREIDEYPKVRENLKAYILRNNMENVELLGLQKDIVYLYNKSKIFIQPTENWKVKMLPPLSVFEAAACNCINLVSDVPWHLELINTLGGISFKVGDENDLSKKIIEILQNYWKYYNRKLRLKPPHIRDVAKSYLELYEEVLGYE